MAERVKIHTRDWVSLVVPEKQDIDVWYRWMNNQNIVQFLWPTFWKLYSREAEEKFYDSLNKDNTDIVFCIYDEESEKVIWTFWLHEIDYVSRKAKFWIVIMDLDNTSKWIGTKAVKMWLTHAFDVLWLNKIHWCVVATNERALRCYEKCGFQEVWRLKNHEYRMGKYHDEILIEVFNDEVIK